MLSASFIGFRLEMQRKQVEEEQFSQKRTIVSLQNCV